MSGRRAQWDHIPTILNWLCVITSAAVALVAFAAGSSDRALAYATATIAWGVVITADRRVRTLRRDSWVRRRWTRDGKMLVVSVGPSVRLLPDQDERLDGDA